MCEISGLLSDIEKVQSKSDDDWHIFAILKGLPKSGNYRLSSKKLLKFLSPPTLRFNRLFDKLNI